MYWEQRSDIYSSPCHAVLQNLHRHLLTCTVWCWVGHQRRLDHEQPLLRAHLPLTCEPCAETYLRSLVVALGTSGAWVALVEGREGVRLHSAVGPLCGVGEVHGWQNSLSLWTCSPATHRVLLIEDTTEDARRVLDAQLCTCGRVWPCSCAALRVGQAKPRLGPSRPR